MFLHNLLGAPSIEALESCGGIRIIEETARFCSKISSILLNDHYGHHVDSIKGTEEERMKEIYQGWLDNQQEYCSWEALCDYFRQCQLGDLADRIETYIGIYSQPTSPGNLADARGVLSNQAITFPQSLQMQQFECHTVYIVLTCFICG